MKFFIFFLLMLPTTYCWAQTEIQKGEDSHKLSLIFIPSGFNDQDEFENEVSLNLKQLWQNNFFKNHRQRFDVSIVTDQLDADGTIKSDAEVIELIAEHDTCNYGDYPFCSNIHIVIQNESGRNEATGDFVRLRLEAKNYYSLAHEISVHVLGDLRPYGGPFMKDEYIKEQSCRGYTYGIANAHDRNSNEKWSNFIDTPPYPGSAYCTKFFRPTQYSIARGSNNRDCDPIGYRAAEMGLAKRTRDGSYYDDTTRPVVNINAQPGNYSKPVDILVEAADNTGVERVEFYASIGGHEYRTVSIDWNAPYLHTLNLRAGEETWIRVYVYDKAWNIFGYPDAGAQIGPFFGK